MSLRRCLQSPTGPSAERATQLRASIPSFRTERLVLRAPVVADFPVWRDLMVPDSDGILGGPHTEEEAWDAFCVYTAAWLLHGHGLWTIEIAESAVAAGFVFLGLEWADDEPELGWMLLPECRGKGIAEEAAQKIKAQGFDLFGAGGFVSYVAKGNAPSNRLAERLGAVRDHVAEASVDSTRQTHVWRHGVPV